MLKPRVPVAEEGYPFIFFAAFATLLLTISGCAILASVGLLVTGFILYFFRDPERFVPEKAHAIVSPADGKVIVVETIKDETFLHQEAYKISIFMNVFNVHVNRAPLAGTVEKIIYNPGKFYAADSAKSALLNENCATLLITERGVRIAVVQVAGLIARRIINWLEVNDAVKKGERIGLIRFGSRVDIYLPADTLISVEVGQTIRAGESIIGYLNH